MIPKKNLVKLLNKIQSCKILVVGDVIVDKFIYGNVSRISPEAPVPILEVTDETYHLGGCANVANNIVSMGGKPTICGAIGDDKSGQWFIDTLDEMDVCFPGIFLTDRPTSLKTRVVAHSQQMVRIDKEVKKSLSQKDTDSILECIELYASESDAIIISDYDKGVVNIQLLDGIREIKEKYKIPVCVDPKKNNLNFYRGFDVIKPNRKEFENATGLVCNLSDPDYIYQIIDDLKIQALLITMGQDGMLLFEKGNDVHSFPTVAHEVFDIVGAGDTAIAVFTMAIAVGASYSEAAILSNLASGVVVGKIGTSTCSVNEILSLERGIL